MCEFRFCNQVFRVCCVYAPNSNPQRNQFLDDVSVSIDQSGDFNTVYDRSLDRRASDPFDVSRESSCALNRLLNPFPSKGFPIDEQNRLALARVKSISAQSAHSAVKGLTPAL